MIGALEDRVERLREDPAMLEQLAREELLMARPGEVVIVLPEDRAQDTQAETDSVSSEAGEG